MADSNSFYFSPIFLSLLREVPDFYDESRNIDPEEAAIKEESECTKDFAKEIIFNRIRQMRINAIQALLERQRCKKIPEGEGSMPIMAEEGKRSSKTSKGSRRSRRSGSSRTSKQQTTTTIKTTTIIETVQQGDLINFSDNSYNFERRFLEETNKYRIMHGSPPLTLNRQLCNFAREWAKVCVETQTLDHRPDNMYGENLLAAQGATIDPAIVVKSWYDEIAGYNYDDPVFSIDTGHFTQLIWKNTTEVGVAIVVVNEWTYVVANYSPPGNVRGQFRENVLKKKF